MTLDGYALTGLFVVMFGFLAFSAWVLERHPADPISGDRRHQAHPFDAPTTRTVPDAAPARLGSPGRAIPPAERG